MSARYLGQAIIGQDEHLTFAIDWANFGAPAGPIVTMLDASNTYADVTATALSGLPSVAGTTVTLPEVVGSALMLGHGYQLLCHATVGGQERSCYLWITVER